MPCTSSPRSPEPLSSPLHPKPLALRPPANPPKKTNPSNPPHSYKSALEAQPPHPLLQTPVSNYTAYALLAAGNTLVLTSMYALGVTGTYLGDYFGILMDAPVTSFPFNVTGSPMYWGSTMSFLGTALLFGRPAGVVLTALVYVAYSIALRYEDPFTAEIYAKRERERKVQGGKKSS